MAFYMFCQSMMELYIRLYLHHHLHNREIPWRSGRVENLEIMTTQSFDDFGITERYWFFCFNIYYIMIIVYIHLEIVIIAIIICDFYIKVAYIL
jgi:hypothetical protein